MSKKPARTGRATSSFAQNAQDERAAGVEGRAPRGSDVQQITSPAILGKKKSGRTVWVACKMPNGMVLQLQRKVTFWEDSPSGAKQRERFDKVGPTVVVCGPGYPVMPPKGYPKQFPVEGGYGLTRGVDAEFFEEWMAQNADAPYVQNKIIFGHVDEEDAEAEAREFEKLQSGFQPLEVTADKVTDERIPRPQNPNIFYTQADAAAAESR